MREGATSVLNTQEAMVHRAIQSSRPDVRHAVARDLARLGSETPWVPLFRWLMVSEGLVARP